jgi:hypothetical protein
LFIISHPGLSQSYLRVLEVDTGIPDDFSWLGAASKMIKYNKHRIRAVFICGARRTEVIVVPQGRAHRDVKGSLEGCGVYE